MILKEVKARKIKNSNGEEAIEVEIDGCRASAPSGKSRGKHESKPYYRNINFCVKFLNGWRDELEINEFNDLEKAEEVIRRNLGLKDAKKFGGNSLFAFESAILKALAKEKGKELWEIINPKARKIPSGLSSFITFSTK